MLANCTIDGLASKLERIHTLADILLTLYEGEPKAQVLTEIILETSSRPED